MSLASSTPNEAPAISCANRKLSFFLMSLRLRLTLWYSALLAGLLLLIAVMALSRVQARVSAEIDAELKRKGDHIVRLLEQEALNRSLLGILLPRLADTFEPEIYVQIWYPEQNTIQRSENLGNDTIRLPKPYRKQALAGASGYYSRSLERPNDLRVYFAPVKFGGEVIAIALVARNLGSEQLIIRELATNLFWIILIALVVGGAVGYWLAGVTLRPIQEATATALAITRTGRLDRRVPVHSTRNDEIGTLISTFNEMLDRLQELFDKQRRFSGDISHELRSPLTTILGNISLLRRSQKLPEADRAEMLDEIQAEAERMNRLISDLLLIAQADADLIINREPVELDTLLLEVYRQAQRQTEGKIELRLLHEDQAIVLGDAERLRQMLVNLINNAMQYTSSGGRIDLSLECVADQAQITISDTGQGIAPEDLPFIFDRFYRADKARSRDMGGTGLGLSIVKWVVEAHGGEIEVESALGEGTTFRVRLPLATGYDGENLPQKTGRSVKA